MSISDMEKFTKKNTLNYCCSQMIWYQVLVQLMAKLIVVSKVLSKVSEAHLTPLARRYGKGQ